MTLAGARRAQADEGGQTVVLVALLFTLLLGFTGAAVDAGRFYAERRFLQNAVDAAALGCVQKLVAGGTQAQAQDQGKTALRSYNLPGDPTGTGIVVSDTPQYNTWFNTTVGDKRNLYDGVYAGSTDCRAAVQGSMQTHFLRLFGLATLSVPANAHAAAKGGMLPVVVNRYKDPPGPSGTFTDYSKQEAYQLANPNLCSEDGGGGCPDAAEADIDCTVACLWGPETVIAGQGYSSSDSDFRGFIALDVRDFTSVSHVYYNGTAGMNTNQLKAQEASYINGGYPGPDLEAYVPGSNPVQTGLQVATMSGNSSGIVVSNFQKYFRRGEKVLVQLFDGQVREIPDFTINPPSTIGASSPSGPASGPTFRVGANQRFRDASCSGGGACWVDLEMVQDTFNGGPENDTPAAFHHGDITFSQDDFTPAGGSGTQVTIQNMVVDAGLGSGIYSVIVRGTGHDQPVPAGATRSTHQAYVPLNVGGVTRDFAMNFDATTAEVAAGDPAVYTFTLTTGASSQAWGASAVSVALDRGTCTLGNIALVVGVTTVCSTATILASPDLVPKKNGPPTVTITIPTSGIASTTYALVVRARGTNQDGQPVVHVQELTLGVGTATGGSKYVNVQGYSVFVITSVTSNAVLGRAVSGYYASPNDPALNVARKAGLIPWEVAPY